MYAEKDLNRLKWLSLWLNRVVSLVRVSLLLIVSGIIIALLFAPAAESGLGAFSWSKIDLQQLYQIGIPFMLKIALIINLSLVMWIVWKMTTAMRNLFGNLSLGEVFHQDNANYCWQVSRYYLIALILSYVLTSALNMMTLVLYAESTMQWSFSFPVTHLLAITLIYTLGYFIKLAINLDKDARVIV